MASYTVTFRTTLRTLTINDTFTHSVNTTTLRANATPIAQQFVDIIEDQGLTLKSIQGHMSYGALAGRTLGGQATYSTVYDTATPSVLQQAAPFAVEPEHRIAFAISPDEVIKTGTSSVLNLANAFVVRVEEGLFETKLYKH